MSTSSSTEDGSEVNLLLQGCKVVVSQILLDGAEPEISIRQPNKSNTSYNKILIKKHNTFLIHLL